MKNVYVITCEHADKSKVIMAVKKTQRLAMLHLNWLLDWRFKHWGWTILEDIGKLAKKSQYHSIQEQTVVRRVLVGLRDNRTRYSEYLTIERWELTDDVPTI